MSNRPPKGRQKRPRKESQPPPRRKVVVRHLPPHLPEAIFRSSIAAWEQSIDWSDYVPGKLATTRGQSDIFSRAYLNFRKQEALNDFMKRYNGHPFVSSDEKEYRAIAELAPYQKVPKPLSAAMRSKDVLAGTIEQDPDYLAFLESLKNPTPHEKEAQDVLPKVTPLIEHLRAQKAKNEARAKARKAKDAVGKAKQQEEKRKAAQAQADATSAKIRDRNASNKNAKAKDNKSDFTEVTGPKKSKNSKARANTTATSSTTASASPSSSAASTSTTAQRSKAPSGPTPSAVASQRAPKQATNSTSKTTNGTDPKPASKPKKQPRKKEPRNNANGKGNSSSKSHVSVDISGPTPAEMAALAKSKT